MGKRYDWKVTPQNTPYFKERRGLFLVAVSMLVLNLLLATLFCSEGMKLYFPLMITFSLVGIARWFDDRREMWTWGYVVFWILCSFVFSGGMILWHKAYWWFIGYGVEVLVFLLITLWVIKKKIAGPKKGRKREEHGKRK